MNTLVTHGHPTDGGCPIVIPRTLKSDIMSIFRRLAKKDPAYTKAQVTAVIQGLPADLAIIKDYHQASGKNLIICFDDDPANLQVRLGIARVALAMANLRLFAILGAEAGFGDVDTAWIDAIQDTATRESAEDALMESLRLAPAEYVHMRARKKFVLFGAEDHDLYEQAQRAFAGYADLRRKSIHDGRIPYAPGANKSLDDFVRLLDMRAAKIVTNLSRRMRQQHTCVAALICTEPLMDHVCPYMRKNGPSFLRITPHIQASQWRSEEYEKLMAEHIGRLKNAN